MATYETMTGPQLVIAFNTMLDSSEGKQIAANRPGLKPVTRFADHEAGVKRCEMLASSIRAVSGAKKKEEPEPEPAPKEKKAKGRTKTGVKTNRQKLKDAFVAAAEAGKALTTAQLIKKVYDSEDIAEYRGALNMVLKGFADVNLKKDEDLTGYNFEKGKGQYRLFKT